MSARGLHSYRWRASFLIAVSITGTIAASGSILAQAPQAPPTLPDAITVVRAGDYFRGILMLNDVVNQLSAQPDQAAARARAQAYRAFAFLGLEQLERARAAVDLALKADPSIVVDPTDFNARLAAMFEDARHPTPAPADAEAAGQAAEQAGRYSDAFLAYLKAWQALPEPAPSADDQRIRERIIKVVQRLDTKPLVPDEARQHLKKSDDLIAANSVLGGSATTSQQAAAAELRQAIRIAPWWPDATLKLATTLQKLQRVDEALVNLNLYKLADPAGYAAMERAKTAAETPPATAPAVKPAETRAAAAPLAPVTIYMYWLPTSRGGFKPHVTCDGNLVADLQAGRYFAIKAAPGTHTFDVKHFGVDTQTIAGAFEAGRDHYVRMNVEGFPAHLALRLPDAEQGKAELRDRNIKPNDPNKTYSAQCTAPAPSKGRSDF